MLHFAQNLRSHRLAKGLTQEDIAEALHLTPQSVSKWERGESYPDITLLPPLANILETSIDLLLGMDEIRAARAEYNIHDRAVRLQQQGNWAASAQVYRDALLLYPNHPGFMMGLATSLSLHQETAEAIRLIEKALPLSTAEKQNATMRALLCFLYLKQGNVPHAQQLASHLPHMRECREAIQPQMHSDLAPDEIDRQIRYIILGE